MGLATLLFTCGVTTALIEDLSLNRSEMILIRTFNSVSNKDKLFFFRGHSGYSDDFSLLLYWIFSHIVFLLSMMFYDA